MPSSQATGEEIRSLDALPLGAVWDGEGTRFAVVSGIADAVELCLFDERGEETRVPLPERTGSAWHGRVPGVGPGQRYGFRVHGPWAPREGHRCNPHKLLLDPYACALDGSVRWAPEVHGYTGSDPDGAPDDRDSAPFVPRSVVVDPGFDWRGDRAPATPWEHTVIYELHVRGFSMRHPAIPPALRGTFAGLAHPAALEHLTRLGVTAVELMPVHAFASERAVVERGLVNYWGYNPLGYFAPHAGYGSATTPGAAVREFKEMVRALHAAGIEVILDVVYNHTCEAGKDGPTLCFRGFDNAAYYRLAPDDPSRYVDHTGCGNTVDTRRPAALRLVLDSLRYWVTEMHVDGFRFDLATVLAREAHGFDAGAAFLREVRRDRVLSRVKLVAEPWDLGEGGHRLGGFPAPWSEWNDAYRNATRDFWRGRDGSLGEAARRLTGSADVFAPTRRRPQASVNYVTCHDGFTLRDLVAHDHKHNEANGEDARDGESDNRSWNCGVEGESDDSSIVALRARQRRNLLATLVLSRGVPMLLAGDEIGRTQRGNNNAYCQDNELSWLDWDTADAGFLAFTRALLALRRAHPVLRRRYWLEGRAAPGARAPDVGWYRPDGAQMRDDDWNAPSAKSLGVFLNGRSVRARRSVPPSEEGASLYLILHAGSEPTRFTLPACGVAWWREVLDTAKEGPPTAPSAFGAGAYFDVAARSLRVLQEVRDDAEDSAGRRA